MYGDRMKRAVAAKTNAIHSQMHSLFLVSALLAASAEELLFNGPYDLIRSLSGSNSAR